MSRVTELAWAAGFFDGEGTTYFATSRGRSGRYGTLAVSVVQGDPAPLLRFQAAIGGLGRIHCEGPRRTNLSNNPLYRFTANSYEACEVLRLISSWLSPPKIVQAASALRKWRAIRSTFTCPEKSRPRQKFMRDFVAHDATHRGL